MNEKYNELLIPKSYEVFFDEVNDTLTEFNDDSLIKEAFENSVDLREYAKQIENELNDIEETHILEYVKQSQSLIIINDEIKNCDSILNNMETTLTKFKMELGLINNEIKKLQNQSFSINTKLHNREKVQKELEKLISGIFVSPDLINHICDDKVDEQYLKNVIELNKIMKFVKEQPNKKLINSLKDIGPELERLRLIAAMKIRSFFLDKIKLFKSPNSNVPIIQKNSFLKFKELYIFLLDRYKEVAIEIRLKYIYTIRSYYQYMFEKYTRHIIKLQIPSTDKMDLSDYEESLKKTLFGTPKAITKDKNSSKSFNERMQIITKREPEIIVTHVAETQNKKYYLESIFKSINRLLMDNAASEYIFIKDFFFPDNKLKEATEKQKETAKAARQKKIMEDTIALINEIINTIFEPTTKNITKSIKQCIDISSDSTAILMCIRLNTLHEMISQKRGISEICRYFQSLNMILWPRFQLIINNHIENLKKIDPERADSGNNPLPHTITRKYAEYTTAILTLNNGFNDTLLLNNLKRLRSELEILLFKISAVYKQRKQQIIFLLNNYNLIVLILKENLKPNFQEEIDYFSELFNNKMMEYVEEELNVYIGSMMQLLNKINYTQKNNITDDSYINVARAFNQNWKAYLQNINDDIYKSFPNYQTCSLALHLVLQQYVFYYTKFYEAWDNYFNSPTDSNTRKQPKIQPIGTHSIMVEIKKYKSSFV
ncbi:Vps52-domain-containing protein [Neocallimastix lanati (nom. inval.)]|jgi:hypothetical protein|uniref:Vps52-domain-containing protein n=1 Tax=Neocallimastix californiae TaxID=1754190 RepID=A0A1Y2B9P1_9FUNG|nr:Vps52-domain-containing protein [Neocallimastix sp. JGI-2020a]ORY31474.1 Vps52-domain-containing protein [Neocallimastix californiae]|eukprot:ORY31474.1 Vps52-domain-containing protein [Neocallimastix californiae]